jgi:excisionase family DNA binding protein
LYQKEVLMTDIDGDEWLTVQEIAAEIKVDEETVRRWIRRGQLPYLELGAGKAGYRIKRSDLNQFVAQRYRETGKAAA